MHTMIRLRRLVFAFGMIVFALTVSAQDAFASHFRYGTLTWSTPNPLDPFRVKIRLEVAFRWSFEWGPSGAPNLCPAGLPFDPTDLTGVGACPKLGSKVTVDRMFMFHPNGTSPLPVGVQGIGTRDNWPATITVTSINQQEDWMTGVYEVEIVIPSAVPTSIIAFADCCRIGTLQGGNADTNFRVRSTITVRNPINRPPTSSSLPVIAVPRGTSATFFVPAFDPDGDVLTYSIPPITESGMADNAPNGMTIAANSGAVTWMNTAAFPPGSLFTVQFKVQDEEGASVAVDLLLLVVNGVGSPPTVLIDGVASDPTFNVVRGTPFSFNVSTNGNNSPVTLAVGTMPLGANMTPSLPTQSPTGNASSTFTWAPAPNQVGSYIVSYSAVNGFGLQGLRHAHINVTNNSPTIDCIASGGTIEATGQIGANWSISAVLDDGDDDKLLYRVIVDNVQRVQVANLTPPFTTPPFSLLFPIGPHTYSATVTDSFSPTVTCSGTFNIVDTTAPALTLPSDVTLVGVGPGAVFSYTATAHDIVVGNVPVTCSHPSGSTFPYGTTAVTCNAIDGAGNLATGSFTVTVTDPTPPEIDVVVTGTAGNAPWYRSAVTVSFLAADPQTAATGCDPLTFDTDGTHAYSCTATSGGGETTRSGSVQIDQTAPSINAPDLTASATGPTTAIPYPGASADDGSGSGLALFTCTPASGFAFPTGSTTVSCSAEDVAGNPSSHSFTVTVIDDTPPVFDPFDDITVPGSGDAGAVVSFAPAAIDAVSGPATVTCDPASGATFGYGASPVTCRAADAAGNEAFDSFTVTVTDTTPPVITPTVTGTLTNMWYTSDVGVSWSVTDAHSSVTNTIGCDPAVFSNDGPFVATCTATSGGGTIGNSVSGQRDATAPDLGALPDITTQATSPSGAPVSFTFAPADATSGLATAGCSHVSGATYPVGTTTVTCSASDAAGNSANDSFTITVGDTIPPVIDSVAPSASTLGPPNHQMIEVSVTASATDNIQPPPVCSIASVSSNEPQNGLGDGDTPNDWLITGALTVQLRAERSGNGNGRVYTITVSCVDGAGNAATQTATVSVPKGNKK